MTMSEKIYVENQGRYCPNCYSWGYLLLGIKFLNDRMVRALACGECDAIWEDIFVLNTYQNLITPQPSSGG